MHANTEGGSLGWGFHLLHTMYACMLSTYVTNAQVAPGAQCSISIMS